MLEETIGDLVVRISDKHIDLFQGGKKAVNITLNTNQATKLALLIIRRFKP